jgi:hypothetical protein
MNQSIRLLKDLLGQTLAIDSFVRLNSHQPLIPLEQVREPETLPRSRQIHRLRGRQFPRPSLTSLAVSRLGAAPGEELMRAVVALMILGRFS